MQSSTFKIEDLEKARTFENKHFLILSVKMNSEIGHQVFLKSIKNKKTTLQKERFLLKSVRNLQLR